MHSDNTLSGSTEKWTERITQLDRAIDLYALSLCLLRYMVSGEIEVYITANLV